MTIPWYRLAVFALWLAAMSWLTVRKVLPPFFTGEPPVYETSVNDKPRPPVAWHVYLNERRLGWALSEISQQSTDTTEIHSLVHFDNLPLDEILPAYLRVIARESTHAAGSTELEVESNLITNPLNQLVSFYSKFRPKSGQSLVRIDGTVEGDKLKLAVHMGDTAWDTELPMPEEQDSRQLRAGDATAGPASWAVVDDRVLQPFGPAEPSFGHDSRAAADGGSVRPGGRRSAVALERRSWNRLGWWSTARDAGESPDNDKNIRNRLWIHHDGTVVRQEVHLGDHSLLIQSHDRAGGGQVARRA